MTSTVAATSRPSLDRLPRRKPVRQPRLWALRAPIPRRWRVVLMTCSVLVPLVVWVAVAATGTVQEQFLPSPSSVSRLGVPLPHR
ncbi:MAG: hypothetical protein ABW000_09880 [Actinoplanes sp.]